MNNEYYQGWYVAKTYLHFKKLKRCVITENNKKGIVAGTWFKPLKNHIEITFLGYAETSEDLYSQCSEQQAIKHFNKIKKENK